ncbi:MAG: hypothetical protein JNL88_02905 [Bacteroidia bacterium]|nr:hypothetical protein [Bacteroidia bacterium]
MLFAGCKPDLNEPKYTAGDADFSRYVALGNSLAAGYMDNALTLEGQLSSYPALLASRFKLVGGGSFNQPYVHPGNGFGFDFFTQTAVGKVILVNAQNCLGQADIEVKELSGNPADKDWIGNKGPFNNMGVPGAKSYNLFSQIFGKGGAAGNPYFFRMASDTGGASGLSSTVIGDAALVNPTFFTLWIGGNDVLWYATAGGEPNGIPFFEITPVSTFEAAIDTIVRALTAGGAKGLIANVPDIADIPYFITIPYNGLQLTAAEAVALNAVSPPGISFQAGANAFVVSNPGGGTIRQIREGELLLLSISQDSLLCGGLGTPQKPIPSRYVLDSTEVQNIRQATLAYNSKLRNAATAKNLAYADMFTFFKTFTSGFQFNGASYTTAYIQGGAFSLDGIHPNSRGYAIIANEMIRVINARYNSNLPPVDVNAGTGILFP